MTDDLLALTENYFASHITMPDTERTAVALWTIATHCWPRFDAFGYLCITAAVKRAGKTVLSECVGFACANGRPIAGATPAVVFRLIKDAQPVLIVDEAESLSSEANTDMRAVLNVGYRKGQTIPRVDIIAGKVVEWPAYCPKVFVLIGDVNDTLRDRSIVITMRRRLPGSRYLRSQAERDGHALRAILHDGISDVQSAIVKAYTENDDLSFLPDRDAEIWQPLAAVCAVIAPHRLTDVYRVASDLSAMKSAPPRTVRGVADAELDAFTEEMGVRLLADAVALLDEHNATVVRSADLVQWLHAYPMGPWRRFRGAPIDERQVADLLRPFGVKPGNLRDGDKVSKGYKADDLLSAMADSGI